MNEQDIKDLKKAIEIENAFLKKHVHQSITKLQPIIDKFTTKIYQLLKEEIAIFNANGFNVLIFPNINFYANDIAPQYGSSLELTYYINLYTSNTNIMIGIDEPSETMKSKLAELLSEGITIDLEIAPHTKMSLVKEFVQTYANGQKKY